MYACACACERVRAGARVLVCASDEVRICIWAGDLISSSDIQSDRRLGRYHTHSMPFALLNFGSASLPVCVHAHTHARARARARAHTHTHTHTCDV